MEFSIRQEQLSDYAETEKVVETAFAIVEHSDQTEHHLVARIRKSDSFISELSLVATEKDSGKIIGHILLSKITIGNDDQAAESLALAPVSVLPDYQHQGVGKRLIVEALNTAKELGYHSVIVLGHPAYYPKFGFKKASLWGITAPFEVPDEAFMAIELQQSTLNKVSGVVRYSSAFFE